MIDLLNLTEEGLNANTAVELRKAGAELGIKGASKGRKADLIAEIMKLVDAAKAKRTAEAVAKIEAGIPRARKTGCEDCGRRVNRRVHPSLCEICYDYAGWENTHNDDAHADSTDEPVESMTDCPVCHSELDRRPRNSGRSRAGMVIVARGTEVHKSATFKAEAERNAWMVKVLDTFEGTEGETPRYVATAVRANGDQIELAWNGRAYDYANSSATLKGKARKIRNLKEALRLLAA